MRQRLRSKLTYANVMVTILAFLVLGGGSAMAAYVVSSNSQIGPNTVSGHKPPSGKHANIISGSVNGQDVQDLHFTFLQLKNGWQGNCSSTGYPAIAKSAEGVVYFRGDLCRTSGSSQNPFAVPPGFHPTHPEWLPVDQYNASTGQFQITTTGQAWVVDDPDHVNSGANFTSLAGVNYSLPF